MTNFKFAIALCLLFVNISCQNGHHEGHRHSLSGGDLFSSITDQIVTTLDSRVSDAQTMQETIREDMTSAIDEATTYVDTVGSTMRNASAEHMGAISSMATNAMGNWNSCLSLSINFEEMVKKIGSEAVACAKGKLDKLLSRSEAILSKFEFSMSFLSSIAMSLETCMSNIQITVPCIISIWVSMTRFTITTWTGVLAEAAILSGEYALFPISLASCDVSGPIAALTDDALKSYTEVSKCISQNKISSS